MGNERLQQLFIIKILALVLCFWGVGGMARAENPLFQPIVDQNLAAIEYLVRQGIDVNEANEFGLTPLEFAIRSKSVASAQLLFRYGASFDLIEPAVINEFRFQPGIGPFVDRYASATNRTPTIPVVEKIVEQRAAIAPRNTAPRNTAPRTTLPATSPVITRQVPQQTITVSSSSFLASSSLTNARNIRTPMNGSGLNTTGLNNSGLNNTGLNAAMPQTSIGIANPTNLQTETASNQNLNNVLENVLENLETSPINVVTSNQLTANSTITVAPAPKRPAVTQPAPNNNQFLALRQPAETENPTNTPSTTQETVALLPAPATPKEVAVPVVEPQTIPQQSQQVRYSNPSQACRVSNYNLVVSFTFDDGESSDLDVIEKVFTPRQATGTLGIILNRLDTDSNRYMQTSDLRRLYSKGWEIASHTIDHDDLTSLDSQSLDDDLLKSHQGLQNLGFNVSSLVYPYGANNNLVRAHTSKYYYGAFEGGYRLNTRNSNPFKLKRFHIAEAHDFNYYKRVTDSYSDQHGWLVWAVHTNLNFGEQQVEDLHELLDYMCDQGIRVVTAREGLDHLNLVDYE